MNKKIIVGSTVIGLVIGLVLGIFVSILWILPSSIPAEQVLVSGTVSNIWGSLSGNDILYFDSVNQNATQTIQMSSPVTNGHYSIVLIAGLSYYAFLDNNPPIANRSTFMPFRWIFDVPLGVTTFTQNFCLF
jgi:hypothetical protein